MQEILGNLKGIRNSLLDEMRLLYKIKIEDGQLLTQDLAIKLAALTYAVNREISVYLNRAGQVLSVAVGDDKSVVLPEIGGRRGGARLSGIRCLHTHPGGSAQLSAIDLSALKSNRFDAMIALGVNDSDFAKASVGFALIIGTNTNGEYICETWGPLTLSEAENIYFPNLIRTVEKLLAQTASDATNLARLEERTVLVGMEYGGATNICGWSLTDSVEELKQLADTAGATVVAKFLQKRPKADPAFFIGRGKIQELALYVQQENIDLVIFDDELSPAQQRNIEQAVGVRVLDRTALILDIFAQRARTNEGKLQVELAQLQYTLPRIMGKGLSLSRLGGGIGTRGPGETKLEVDRRRIRGRITYLESCIERAKSVRKLHRVGRTKAEVATVALVGYTNSGKSTLLNTLTDEHIYAQDQLFATLDPTTRQLNLPDKQQALLTDTVGFIQRLPHQLVAAFQSTLEEVVEADILLHIIDVSHQLYKEQCTAVYRVLEEIGARDKTVITVYNKIDKLPSDSLLLERLAQEENSICISAKSGWNLEKLLQLIAANLQLKSVEETYLIPYNEANVAARLHTLGTVLATNYLEQGSCLRVRLSAEQASEFVDYLYKGE